MGEEVDEVKTNGGNLWGGVFEEVVKKVESFVDLRKEMHQKR